MGDSSEGAAEEGSISRDRRVLEAMRTEQHLKDSFDFHMRLALIFFEKKNPVAILH